MAEIVECVPNFSEGRDAAVIEALAAAVSATPGACLLDRTSDPDHNRSVLTFAGPPQAVRAAALAVVTRAVELIDVRTHAGVHPRLGAIDVVPFVPVAESSLESCVRLAVSAGQDIWERLRVPVYLYEAAARRDDRVNLADVRRGELESLRAQIGANRARMPDIGDAVLHPTAGAVIVGARRFLIAYNVDLETPDVQAARAIARAVRQSSGGFACVKALGLYLPSRRRAQVSMNLTDFERIPVEELLTRIEAEAARLGTRVAARELIGMVPRAAWARAPQFYQGCVNWRPGLIVENRLGL
jgi:glutamate formiminotransferase